MCLPRAGFSKNNLPAEHMEYTEKPATSHIICNSKPVTTTAVWNSSPPVHLKHWRFRVHVQFSDGAVVGDSPMAVASAVCAAENDHGKADTALQDGGIRETDRRQMIFAAHNSAVIDGLNLQEDRIRLFAVDRDN